MGIFQAYSVLDDRPVIELSSVQTIQQYFTKIIQKAFPAPVPSPAPAPASPPATSPASTLVTVGTISGASEDEIYRIIAREEDKYYYKWLEGDASPQYEGHDILNKLIRVNVVTLRQLWEPHERRPPEEALLRHQLGKQDPPAHWLSENTPESVTADNKMDLLVPLKLKVNATNPNLFDVLVNTKGMAWYLDTTTDTMFYKFKKNGAVYFPERTAKIIERHGITDAGNIDYDRDKRFLARLIEYIVHHERIRNDDEISKLWDPPKDYSPRNLGTKLKAKITDGFDQNKALLLSFIREDCRKEAEYVACQLPHDYTCCYFADKNALNAFITSVHFGGESGGFGGYAMRADKLSEVEYKWDIYLPSFIDSVNEKTRNWAELMRTILDLESACKIDATGVPADFHPTNCPIDESFFSPFTKAPVTGVQLFKYYKKFKPGARRNAPAVPNPPRIPKSSSTATKRAFKLDNISYRKWKKGDQFLGEQPRTNPEERQNASSVMADALSYLSSYQTMITTSGEKITWARLPATEFTKFVITNDRTTAGGQWTSDNGPDLTLPSTIFPQEWCHLFGHGDGGTEELGNFVAGSKHCNTEQLAIETGLRRVTQSSYVSDEIKKLIKVKITAYLMPNKGAWVNTSEEWPEDDLYEILGIPSAYKVAKLSSSEAEETSDYEIDSYIESFFFEPDVIEEGGRKRRIRHNIYKLRPDEELQAGYLKLMGDIKNAINGKKAELVNFQQNLVSHFFMYYPLARWMRYKIYVGTVKVFDHVYDAQSQSFDYNECQILDYTVERAIYMGMEKFNSIVSSTGTTGSTSGISSKKVRWDKGQKKLVFGVPPAGETNNSPEAFYLNLIIDRIMQLGDEAKVASLAHIVSLITNLRLDKTAEINAIQTAADDITRKIDQLQALL